MQMLPEVLEFTVMQHTCTCTRDTHDGVILTEYFNFVFHNGWYRRC